MPTDPTSLIQVIRNNRSKKTAASTIVEGNPAGLPVISKLTADKTSTKDINDERNFRINRATLETLYAKMSALRTNNKHILSLFPDIELAIQILVSSILSPKKMTDIQLNYRFNKNFILNPNISTGVLDSIKEYIEETYELEDRLPEIVREALFISGSCPYAIIAESSVDDLINTDLVSSLSTEQYKNSIDIALERFTSPINIIASTKLSNTKTLNQNPKSKEDFVNYLIGEAKVLVTDNPGILQVGELRDKITSSIIKKEVRNNTAISTESLDKIEYLDVFRNRGTSKPKQIQFIKTKEETTRKSIGKPMFLKLPHQSVIPAFTPGNESDHLGYFVLLDENFKPISGGFNESDMNRLDHTLHTGNKNTPIQKAYNNLIATSNNENIDVNSLFETYKNVLETQLFGTIKSTLNGKSVSISERNDIYFTMFCRALQDQKTTILYLRKESVVYYAFQYTELGIGKSLLDNLAVQSSLRAILLFSRVMSESKQAIDVTNVNIEFDPDDPDPEKTAELIQSSVMKMRQNFLPLGINNPVDLVNWVQRAGIRFSYTNNPLMPNTQISFDNGNLSHTVPSGELEENLRKQSIIALGLPPETVDNGFSPEFARTVINNNILLSKRVGVYQKKLNALNTKMVNLLIYNDEDLRLIIKDIILEKERELIDSLEEEEKQLLTSDKEKFIEYYIDKLADNLYLELPKPEDTDISNLSAEYDLYKENLEKTLDSVISPEIFSEDLAGDIANNIESIRNVYKHYLLRKWMADNNFYPETLEITDTNIEEVESVLTSIATHLTSTMRNADKLFRMMKEIKEAVNLDLNKTFEGEEPDSSVSSNSGSGGTEEEGGEDGDDGLGGNAEDFLDGF